MQRVRNNYENMKRDLKLLFEEAGKKTKEKSGKDKEKPLFDFEHLSLRLVRHHVNLSAKSLKKLWEIVTGKRKLSAAAKNRLALFAGFQSWDDLDDTIHGDTDASVNYN